MVKILNALSIPLAIALALGMCKGFDVLAGIVDPNYLNI